jgi:hypothetical protein
VQRSPRTFLVTCAPERRRKLASVIAANRMRANSPVLVAAVPPAHLPERTECVLLPHSADEVALAARASDGIIIVTDQLADDIGAARAARGLVIVLLGHSDPTHPSRLTHVARSRLLLARRLARRHAPVLRAVILSGRGVGDDSMPPEADQYALHWSGERLPLLREVASTTTHANAIEAAAMIEALGGVDEILLVTSWWHARRARYEMLAALADECLAIPVRAAQSYWPLPKPRQLRGEHRWRVSQGAT